MCLSIQHITMPENLREHGMILLIALVDINKYAVAVHAACK